MFRKSFVNYKQPDTKDCGPTCLKIISKHYNSFIPLQLIRDLCQTQRQGSSILNLSEAAERLGFRSFVAQIELSKLRQAPLPCILFWDQKHYVVLYKIKKGKFYISDPASGLQKYNEEEFGRNWLSSKSKDSKDEGVVLLLEPTSEFQKNKYDEKDEKNNFSLYFFIQNLLIYKKFLWQLILGLSISSLLQLLFPFLTQSIVDVGIMNEDLSFIYLILVAQLFVFAGRISVEIIRNWILLHLSTRINISLVSEFFIKLMRLPISFFDTRMTGDIIQRINDHQRIERLLTTSSLNTLFSVFNISIFGLVLAYYSIPVFSIFLIGGLLYIGWIFIFLKKREKIDYRKFSVLSEEQSKIIELVNGMQDIKLHNAEREKRWGWEAIQSRIFKISVSSLSIEQWQSVGSKVINELTTILITVLAATQVVNGEITLGMMLAISYIIGQINTPITQLVVFFKEFQDAQISISRLNEIHGKKNEESNKHFYNSVPPDKDIFLEKVSFKYPGTTQPILRNIQLIIPKNKITAIVGTSGSGKTTLLKILLRYYDPTDGKITLGKNKLDDFSQKAWRESFGVVVQEGYIFNESISRNIAIGEENINQEKLFKSVYIANIKDFIDNLPQSYNTKIGNEGLGLSTGQKQRILIARAVYKDPDYIFFDEATSALDANNERRIIEKLEKFFEERTVVIVAHRLSTVKNAHQIVVLDDGEIAEIGNHTDLISKRGKYYNLIKNQLELGN